MQTIYVVESLHSDYECGWSRTICVTEDKEAAIFVKEQLEEAYSICEQLFTKIEDYFYVQVFGEDLGEELEDRCRELLDSLKQFEGFYKINMKKYELNKFLG